jgi:hypothetical protein
VLRLCRSPSVLMSGARMSVVRGAVATRTAVAGRAAVDDSDRQSTVVEVDMGSATEGKAAGSKCRNILPPTSWIDALVVSWSSSRSWHCVRTQSIKLLITSET